MIDSCQSGWCPCGFARSLQQGKSLLLPDPAGVGDGQHPWGPGGGPPPPLPCSGQPQNPAETEGSGLLRWRGGVLAVLGRGQAAAVCPALSPLPRELWACPCCVGRGFGGGSGVEYDTHPESGSSPTSLFANPPPLLGAKMGLARGPGGSRPSSRSPPRRLRGAHLRTPRPEGTQRRPPQPPPHYDLLREKK